MVVDPQILKSGPRQESYKNSRELQLSNARVNRELEYACYV